METLSLHGVWRCKPDPDATFPFSGQCWQGEPFVLPGSACENRIGTPLQWNGETDPDTLRAPRERYEYTGPLWLQREIEVPETFAGKNICLFLERVSVCSRLWVDGAAVGRPIVTLSAPHVYDLTGRLTPGRHRLTLCIDNRDCVGLGDMASGYSLDTQGHWNGVIGRIELQARPLCHLADVQIYPQPDGVQVRVVEACTVHKPEQRQRGTIALRVTAPDGSVAAQEDFDVTLYTSRQVDRFTLPLQNIRWWQEFDPALYTLTAEFSCEGCVDQRTLTFGMRRLTAEGRQFILNGRPLSLRGTNDCALTPQTGYPPMTKADWLARLGGAKEYGLNHVRFHAWCPPEAAFEAADELGLYLTVEMPLWLNLDVQPLEFGQDPVHGSFFLQEALRISRSYGNHPSFLFFSNGNENLGDFSLLEEITTAVKAIDPRRLYTVTSNFDHPLLPCEDYLCAFQAAGHPVRLQHCQDRAAQDTALDYAGAVAAVEKPVVTFEVGQYCVYPDVDIIADYTGAMRPVNFEAIRLLMQRSGVYEKRAQYVQASGVLAARLYKEEIEAALRTEGLGGFELLGLTDYTGQKTATIGLLDVEGRSKGLVTPAQFRCFAGPVVPLFKAKRIFTTDETLEAELALYDHGPVPLDDPVYEVDIRCDGRLFYHTKTRTPRIAAPLCGLKQSARLDVTITVAGYSNSWRVFAFAPAPVPQAPVVSTPEALEEIGRTGGCALVTRACFDRQFPCNFIPVFWSPVFFPSKAACGVMIDASHPALRGFPTGPYGDYQWKDLLERAVSFPLPRDGSAEAVVEMVPNFYDNTPTSPLALIRRGKALLLFCGFDLDQPDPATRQLKASLYTYVAEKNKVLNGEKDR